MEELGCRCFQKLGYEADDVMASLSRWGRSKSLSVVHVSSDKDMLQVRPHVLRLPTIQFTPISYIIYHIPYIIFPHGFPHLIP